MNSLFFQLESLISNGKPGNVHIKCDPDPSLYESQDQIKKLIGLMIVKTLANLLKSDFEGREEVQQEFNKTLPTPTYNGSRTFYLVMYKDLKKRGDEQFQAEYFFQEEDRDLYVEDLMEDGRYCQLNIEEHEVPENVQSLEFIEFINYLTRYKSKYAITEI